MGNATDREEITMETIIQKIEASIADIVEYASIHSERYKMYCIECNKPSHSYNHARRIRLFSAARKYAEYSVDAAQCAGLNPEIVTRQCCIFLDEYKGGN